MPQGWPVWGQFLILLPDGVGASVRDGQFGDSSLFYYLME